MIVVNTELTLGEVYSFPEPSPANASQYAGTKNSSKDGGYWYGGVKRADAMAFANGYTMPASARALYDTLTEDLPVFTNASKRRTRQRREEGDYISDFAAYETFRAGLTRDTAFWSDMHRTERRAVGIVSLGINTSTHAGQPQEQLEFRGASALALCDYLEALGYRVAIWGFIGARHNAASPTWEQNTAIELKPADGMLSENAMAYVCHLGVWRHFSLAYIASLPRDAGTGYGSPMNYAGPVTVDVTVPVTMGTEASAKAWLTETLRALKERGE